MLATAPACAAAAAAAAAAVGGDQVHPGLSRCQQQQPLPLSLHFLQPGFKG
jgi:hypothetical protein